MIRPGDRWYPLDNTAKIFPSIVSKRLTTVFRISAVLKEQPDETRLQEALETTLDRYPYFRMTLKKGLFWYYLRETRNHPTIEVENEAPCRPFKKRFSPFLFRVLIYKKRLSLECSHSLTDGTGALKFLTTLLETYVAGERLEDLHALEETEDSYLKYYRKNTLPPSFHGAPAFHLPGPLIASSELIIVTGIMPIEPLKEEAKKYNLTITEYLATHIIMAMQEFQFSLNKRKIRPIRLMIPVNLRKIYPSHSVRNFFLSLLPEIDPRLGRFSFEEIALHVSFVLRSQTAEKYINQQIRQNVGAERHLLIRHIPLVLKIPLQRIIYGKMSNKRHSGVFTNLGSVAHNESWDSIAEGIRFLPNPNPGTKLTVGVASFKNQLALSFTSHVRYRDIEKMIFRKLREMDIPVTIETNE